MGEFKDDKANGGGVIIFPDGAKFKGTFKDNIR